MTPHASAVAPEATGGDGSRGSAMEAAARSKPRKRKKSRPATPPPSMEAAAQSKPSKRKKKKVASSSAAAGPATPSPPSSCDGDGNGTGTGDGQQQQLAVDGRGKQRVVWSDELHDMFLKAYNILGEDAVPKKILALMNVDGITRENVASHLQKYRLSLKQEEKRILPDKGDERPTLDAEASSSQTLLPTTPSSPHPPPAQAQEPAPSSSLHPLPPQEALFAALDVSRLQIGRDGQQLLQTPPDCFDVNTATATNLLLDQEIPMAQPIQQRFTPPPPPPPEATVATRRKLFKKQQEAGQAAVVASGYSAVLVGWNNAAQALDRTPPAAAAAGRSRPGPHMQQASQAVSIASGERSVPMARLGMGGEAGEGQGQAAALIAAEPEAAEIAAGPEEGQGPGAGEPGAAPAGSVSPPGSSIHGQYWKIDDAEVSWDFGFLWTLLQDGVSMAGGGADDTGRRP